MLEDFLSETPMHKFYMQRALEKAREEVPKILREEDRKEGAIQSLRQLLVIIFQERFPQLSEIAEEKASQIQDPSLLKKLILKIAPVQTVEEAGYYLLMLDHPDKFSEQH